jgi:hypothetical protein
MRGRFGTSRRIVASDRLRPSWRNVVEISIRNPTWQQIIPITGPAQAGQLMVGLQFRNIPVGGRFSLNVPGPDKANTVIVTNQPVADSNEIFSVQVAWPANFSTTMTISYNQGPTPPPPGASISPFLAVPTSSLKSLSAHATARLNARVRPVKTFSSAAMTDAHPESLIKLGTMEYRFK